LSASAWLGAVIVSVRCVGSSPSAWLGTCTSVCVRDWGQAESSEIAIAPRERDRESRLGE
jgi:hypothetical protein